MMQEQTYSVARWCVLRQAGIAALALLLCSCASLPEKYQPSRVGPNLPPEAAGGIEIEIRPLAQNVRIGDPIEFDVLIHNRNGHAVTLPRNPQIEMVWVYPNGDRDSTVHPLSSASYFTPDDVIELSPGQVLRASISIPSYYFPRPGITEFRAILYAPRNLNPELTNYWSGRAYSNSFGILLLPAVPTQRM